MPKSASPAADVQRSKKLLTQNREMKAIGVWNWTLPAWAGRFADGRTYNTCPSAGICRNVCYARNGTYLWPVVLGRHQANLRYVMDDPAGWESRHDSRVGCPEVPRRVGPHTRFRRFLLRRLRLRVAAHLRRPP
jgi:hypothetical protein